jgi:hypothetical protein
VIVSYGNWDVVVHPVLLDHVWQVNVLTCHAPEPGRECAPQPVEINELFPTEPEAFANGVKAGMLHIDALEGRSAAT